MGHLDHCRWLSFAWLNKHWQILTSSFDSYIVSWNFLWFPVVSRCSLFKPEKCKLMQDHARKCQIRCYNMLHCALCLGLPGMTKCKVSKILEKHMKPVTLRYALTIKQNHKIVKKLFSYDFDMHLLRAKKNMPAQPNANILLPVRSAKQKVLLPAQ